MTTPDTPTRRADDPPVRTFSVWEFARDMLEARDARLAPRPRP